MSGIQIVRATLADRPQVRVLLRRAFYQHEPLNIAMGLTDEPGEADINHSLQSLPQGNSFMAVENGNIIGVALNGEITDNEVNVRKKLYDECECKEFVTFLKFWVQMEILANVWEKVGVRKGIDLEILAVDPEHRGRGVGKMLIEKSKALSKELGYEMLRMDCSSYYAAKLAEEQGMTCVFQMNYSDYKDDNGEVVFQVKPPHVALKIYTQRL